MAQAAPVRFPHIEVEGHETPVIAGSTMKVIELVTAQDAYGWSPDELHFQYPHLTMGQIHSALAYYWEHKEELDAEIERRERWVEEMRPELEDSEKVRRLRERIYGTSESGSTPVE